MYEFTSISSTQSEALRIMMISNKQTKVSSFFTLKALTLLLWFLQKHSFDKYFCMVRSTSIIESLFLVCAITAQLNDKVIEVVFIGWSLIFWHSLRFPTFLDTFLIKSADLSSVNLKFDGKWKILVVARLSEMNNTLARVECVDVFDFIVG